LDENNQFAKTISIVIKYPNFHQHTKSFTNDRYFNELEEIFLIALKLYDSNFVNQKIRLIGVSLSNLSTSKTNQIQLGIFADDSKKMISKKQNDIDEIIEKINDKFDTKIINKASKIIK